MFSDEDVFFEFGGDSVSVQQLITAAKAYGINLTMEQVFLHASLADMAKVALALDTSEELRDGETSASQSSWVLHDTEIEAVAQQCDVVAEDLENTYPCTPTQKSLTVRQWNLLRSYELVRRV
jgi:hypothetical protein